MQFYCISVRTGTEEKYEKSVLPIIEGDTKLFFGKLHIFKKLMQLKNGKKYFDYFFSGYVFLETDETNIIKLKKTF